MTILEPIADAAGLRPCFDRLAERLRSALGGRRMVFMQNDGNLGDALIRFGTIAFFEDLGIAFEECDMGSRVGKLKALALGLANGARGDRLFVYSGSGAWSKTCDIGWRNVRRQSLVTRNLFVLPSTFQKFGLDGTIPVFSRDRYESLACVPHAAFCHDMAFYLTLIDPARVLPDRVAPAEALGLMFRTDTEASPANLARLPGNHDISATGSHRSDVRAFLREIDRYECILTDRLHVAIAGIVLGKRVRLVENNYFKIRAIYRSSIAPYFAGVTLEDAEAIRGAVDGRATAQAGAEAHG